jgi:hypothetical protein
LQKSKTAISRLVFIGSNNSVGKQAKLKEITGKIQISSKEKKQKITGPIQKCVEQRALPGWVKLFFLSSLFFENTQS